MPSVQSTLSAGTAGLATVYLMSKYQKQRRLIFMVALLAFIYKKLGASAKQNPSKLPHYPFLGSGFKLIEQVRSRIHSEVLELSRLHDFKGFSIHLPMDMNIVVLNDEKDRKFVLKDSWRKFPKNVEGRGWRDNFRELFGVGIFAVDNKDWTNHRKAASHMFSNKSLREQMELVFVGHANKLCQFLEKKSQSGDVFELQTLLASFTFDTICDIAFGHDPKALEDAMNGTKNKFLVAFDGLQAICTQRFVDPTPVMRMKRFLRLGMEHDAKPFAEFMHNYIRKIVRARSQEISNPNDSSHARNDLLSMYIRYARSYKMKHMLEESYLVDVVMNFMIAGRDTTSAVMTHMFKLLSANQQDQERLRNELRELTKGEDPTLEKMHEARFADACFNEALRLYPSVATNIRLAAEDTILPSGLKVKKNDQVLLSAYSCGRNPAYFKDPNSFKPQRWIDWDEGKYLRKIPQYTVPVFWGGPRICLGKDMARFEAKVVMAKVLDKFSIDVLPHVEEFQNGPIIFYNHNLPVRVKKI